MSRISDAVRETSEEVKLCHFLPDPENYTALDLNDGLCSEVAGAIMRRIPEAEECVSDFAAHYFVRYRGRYYDAECPDGVRHPNQLPIFRRSFSERRRNTR